MNLSSVNATSSAIFAEIPLSSSYIAMLVVLTKERTVKTVAERCGSVSIPLSLCPIVLHADLLIFSDTRSDKSENESKSREVMSENNKVAIRKATPIDFELAFALEGTLSEWSSKNDEESYGRLQLEAVLKDEKTNS